MDNKKIVTYTTPGAHIKIDICELMLQCAHVLIGGTTGAGKSVLIENLMYTIMCKYTPHDARIFFIDPKRVSFVKYRHLPHVEQLETDFDAILQLLRDLIVTMDKRYTRMSHAGLTQYDGKHIYIIIDEMASIMTDKTVKKDFAFLVQKIAMLGRACNMHLICATQAPNRTVIPANLTVDFDGRIALRCNDSIESRQLIKRNGAETLPRHGKCIMLNCDGFYYCGEIPFIPDEIQKMIDYWLKQGNNNAYFVTHSTNKTPTQRKKHSFLDVLFGDVRFITVKQKKSDIYILNTLSEIDDD